MSQTQVFLTGEGDAWLKRNAKDLPIKDDLVLNALGQLVGGVQPDSSVIEIGCANGWRLKAMRELYGCTKLYGVDPSKSAVKAAEKNGVKACLGTAQTAVTDQQFDIVIYGFCLYLCERPDLFHIASCGDRLLKDGGLMAIYDFSTPMPCKNPYEHKDGIWSYKMDYDSMFLWNPAYTKLITVHHKDGQTKASLLRKNINRGWPECQSESSDLAQ